MQRTRAVVLVMCSVAIIVASWGSAATAGTAAKKKPKLSCSQGAAAIKEIAPLFDREANSQNAFSDQIKTIQFGNLKSVQKAVKAVNASNPLKTVRANPTADVTFPDKNSAIGTLVITLNPERTQTINQGPQYYMCVGKDQNGTKKGAWRITLYSFCNLAALAPCPTDIVTKGTNALSPKLLAETTKKG